ncbi:MAG: MucBP domain-containing protein, partial [Erysipelotrichaceae bacterium]|nr:MucBP domain-containing protein [Erysipelotrichaceae bacterium]
MKRVKLILSLMMAILLLNASRTVTAAASYKYRVTIDPGLHGTYSGTAEMEIPYGSTWNPADYEDNITVTDSDYYFKGFHISGIEGVVGTTDITEDTVFVASYGMKGKTVAYTVNYVDTSGKTLRASATYQGNVGDKPVVAFRYIDGYLPQAYNLEKTLSSDSTKNVFEFEYKKVTPKVVGKSGSGGVTYIVE